jgi:preprotein translocase subunit SecG
MQHADAEQEGKKEHEPTVKCIPNVACALVGRSDNSVLSAAPQSYRIAAAHSQGAGGNHFLPTPFLLILFLSALSGAIGTTFDLKPDSRFMEYVWKGAYGVSETLEKTLWFVAVYLVLITILVATLKIKDDK